jgi:heat shock protein HtpX
MKCPRCDAPLKEVLTRNSVLVDVCPNGHGVWLDGGEIFFFVRNPEKLQELIKKGLTGKLAPGIKCLRCPDKVMSNGRFENISPALDLCPDCQGMWLDSLELHALNASLGSNLDPYSDIMEDYAQAAELEKTKSVSSASRIASGAAIGARKLLAPLPNLALSSSVVLFSLYALLFAALVLVTLLTGVSVHLAVLFAVAAIFIQYLASPFIMDLMLRWIQSLDWVEPESLPSYLRDFIDDVVKKNKMKYPRIGIIRDGAPNAFTYGHTPNNARIVVTQGLIDILNEKEVKAVVAHELGHAKHWDILVMTMAGVVPVILYYIYRLALEVSTRGRNRKGGQLVVVAFVAYLLYIISQYIALHLSRVREYYADRFSGEATGAPDELAIALVKVAYGLAGQAKDKDADNKTTRRPALESAKTFGIFDPAAARGLAAASLRGSSMDVDSACNAMQWDLWNPWALYYEIHSTHPLPAKRINALGQQSRAYGQVPTIQFNKKRPESFWDEFAVDLAILASPVAGAAIGALLGSFAGSALIPGMVLFGLGIGYAIKLAFSYRSRGFAPMNVSTMLKKIKVSSVRPVPVSLKGTIIGRGIPGLIFSEDIVLRDETGYIFLDYRQPLRIIELLFGLFRTDRFIGNNVEVTGWYRRAPVPYIEIRNMRIGNDTHTCYVYHVKIALYILLFIAGMLMVAGGLAI